MTKEYILNGLGCANCSAKIEKEINKLDYVKKAIINFATTKVTLETDLEEDEKILKDISKIAKSVEEQIVVEVVTHNKIKSAHDHHAHEHSHNHSFGKIILFRMGISIGILLVALMLKNIPEYMVISLFFISYLVAGADVIISAVKNILKGELFDENFLMGIATIGAFCIGEFPEAVAVMLFYQLGEYFQEKAVFNSRKSISDLMDIRPDFANILIGNQLKKVSPYEVKMGDIILVKAGEKIPLDGIIIEGKAMVNTTALTGESVPREVLVTDEVLSGFVNENGVLSIKVTKEFSNSTVSKILEMVENASNKKAPTEQFITKFSKVYTPIVVLLAVCLAVIPPLITGDSFNSWLYRALTFLVISCPCALVISIPLGFFGGIGAASKAGVLVKGGNYLEALTKVNAITFDKTGTLTKGVFEVIGIDTVDGSEDEIIKYGAYAEYYSIHPIASAIKKYYGKEINKDIIYNYEEISGHGIKVEISDKRVLAGNKKLMNINNIKCEETNERATLVYIAVNEKYLGCIKIADKIKDDSKDAIRGLRNLGLKDIIMLTGDKKEVAESIADEIGIDRVYSELLPNEKVNKLDDILSKKAKNSRVAFVGDGINDAPVLARADIGIAMGGLGSDAAIEAADIVIMNDEPSKIITAINIAKKTKKIVMENIFLSLGIKSIVLILGALGIASMWLAVFADVGVALLAVVNSLRASKY